jgi:hypothetical protein
MLTFYSTGGVCDAAKITSMTTTINGILTNAPVSKNLLGVARCSGKVLFNENPKCREAMDGDASIET